jgi:parallel beta-helix repeat protein
MVDGFNIDGNHSLAQGSGIDGCADGGGPLAISHHFVAINNIIHDIGGAGLTSCTADFITWTFNVVYNTSSLDLWQSSGIGVWRPQGLAKGSYTPTAYDDGPYGIMITYNITYDNSEGPTIPFPHTDGNGIIIDTTLNSDTCTTCGTPYPGNILVEGNLSYNNGGGGIHVFLSKNVTVVNNTVYKNYQDPLNPGNTRGDLSNGGSENITFMNNIAIAVPGSGSLAYNEPIYSFPVTGFQDSGTWTKNITYGAPSTTDATSYAAPSSNLFGVNPMLTNPAAGNFTLMPGSPAIQTGQPGPFIPSATPNIGAY